MTSKQTILPIPNAKPYIPRIAKNNNNGQNVLPASQSVPCPTAPPPNLQQSKIAQPLAKDDALVCYYHQRFGDKARSCRDPCNLNCWVNTRWRHLHLASQMRRDITAQKLPFLSYLPLGYYMSQTKEMLLLDWYGGNCQCFTSVLR